MNVAEKFKLLGDYWIPRIAIAVSDSYVELVKVKAKLVLHNHKDEDQLFLVLRGCPDNQDQRPRCASPGRRVPIIPRGVWHKPVADDEAYLVLLEKKTTMNTGEVQNERTAPDRWI